MNRRALIISLSSFHFHAVVVHDCALLFGSLTVKLMCVREAQKLSLESLTIVLL
jgi:hypothetical protein